jgi:hypothetical protein
MCLKLLHLNVLSFTCNHPWKYVLKILKKTTWTRRSNFYKKIIFFVSSFQHMGGLGSIKVGTIFLKKWKLHFKIWMWAKRQRNPMLGKGNGPINMCRQMNMIGKYV